MSNKFWVWFVVAAVVLAGGFVFYKNSNAPASPPVPEETGNEPAPQPPVSAVKTWEVRFDGTAFSPAELAVKKGDTVTWVNNGAKDTWPATAMHPTHTVYPDSDIKNCGTAKAGMMFDACSGIKPGGSYSFMFNEVGEWRYHDHLQSSVFGKVTVTE